MNSMKRSTTITVNQLKSYLEDSFPQQQRQTIVEFLLDYHNHGDVRSLVNSIAPLLDTPLKQRVIGVLRRVLPMRDIAAYDHMWVQILGESAISILLPWKTKASRPSSLPRTEPSLIKLQPASSHSTKISLVEIELEEAIDQGDVSLVNTTGPISDVIVKYVEPSCTAAKQGLKINDRIVAVNGTSCMRLSAKQVENLLWKSTPPLILRVDQTYQPYKSRTPSKAQSERGASSSPNSSARNLPPKLSTNDFIWHNKAGRETSPPGSLSASGGRHHYPLIQVLVEVGQGEVMGCSLRGGKEFGLGVYIADVEPGSPAQRGGLKIGDEIIDLNNISFRKIFHAEAVDILRRTSHLQLTVHRVGKLPYALLSHRRSNSTLCQGDHSSLNVPSRRPGNSQPHFTEQWNGTSERHLSSENLSGQNSLRRRQQRRNYRLAAGRESMKSASTSDLRHPEAPLRRTTPSMPPPSHKPQAQTVIPTSHLRGTPLQSISNGRLHSNEPQSNRWAGESSRPISDGRLVYWPSQATLRRHISSYKEGRCPVSHLVKSVLSLIPKNSSVESINVVLSDLRDSIKSKDIPEFDNMVACYTNDRHSDSSDSMLLYYNNEMINPKHKPVVTASSKELQKEEEELKSSLDEVIQMLEIETAEDNKRKSNTSRSNESIRTKRSALKPPHTKNVNSETPGIYKITLRSQPDFECIGIGVTGGTNTKVCPLLKIVDIKPGGSAYECPILKLGQVILQVNGHSLEGLTHKEAAQKIAEAFKDRRNQSIDLLVAEPWAVKDKLRL